MRERERPTHKHSKSSCISIACATRAFSSFVSSSVTCDAACDTRTSKRVHRARGRDDSAARYRACLLSELFDLGEHRVCTQVGLARDPRGRGSRAFPRDGTNSRN